MLLSQKNYEVYNFSIRKIEWLAVILRVTAILSLIETFLYIILFCN